MGISVAPTCAIMEHVWICSKTTLAAVTTDTRADTVIIVSVDQKNTSLIVQTIHKPKCLR